MKNKVKSIELNEARLIIRKLVSEVFGKSLGLGSEFDDEDLNKKSKMAGWLDKKPTSRALYSAETIKKMLDDAILLDDWDIIHDIINNVSFRKLGHVPEEIENLGDFLSDAASESDWHKVAIARKQFKNYVPSSINEHFFFGDDDENAQVEGYTKSQITSFNELGKYKQLLSTDLGSADYFFKYLTNNDLYVFTPSNPDDYIYVLSVNKDSGKFKQGVKFKQKGRHDNINKLSEIPGEILDILF